jgi:hypothetical protein
MRGTAAVLERCASGTKSGAARGAQKVAAEAAASYMNADGEVPEWSNGTVSKTVVRVTVPWVRIPPSPRLLVAVQWIAGDLRSCTTLRTTLAQPLCSLAAVFHFMRAVGAMQGEGGFLIKLHKRLQQPFRASNPKPKPLKQRQKRSEGENGQPIAGSSAHATRRRSA